MTEREAPPPSLRGPVDILSGEHDRFAHDAVVVTVCTLFSRMTGFVRVVVAAAVLSNGVLGDTYQAANIVPNLLFELVAGGVVQAVLVPTFVAARRSGGDEELGRTAGVVVSAVSLVLAMIALGMIALTPFLARGLTGLDSDSAIAADKLAVMTPMLLVFIPQIVFYGIGMVSTAALAARHRFAAAALAPAVNNLVVISCYLLYRSTRDGAPASLDLSTWQFVLLAGGTTLAVISFTAVPGIVLTVQGVRWRPRWQPDHPAVTALRQAVGWAMLSVVGTLAPTAAAVVMGYGVAGGVAVFAMSFAFFVLPHSLIAVPVAIALAPRVASSWQQGRRDLTGDLLERSAQVVVPLLLFAGAAMTALSWQLARVVASFGQAASQGIAPIAHTLAVFGFGLLGYGMAFMMTRVLFSIQDVKGAALLVSVSAVIGVGSMFAATVLLADSDRAAALAFGYCVTQTVSAMLLTLRVRSLTGAPSWRALGRLSIGSALAAVSSGIVMVVVAEMFGSDRGASLAAITVAGASGLVVFLVLAPPLSGVHLSALRRGMRGV